MADPIIPPPPPGFELVDDSAIPPPPPGFELVDDSRPSLTLPGSTGPMPGDRDPAWKPPAAAPPAPRPSLTLPGGTGPMPAERDPARKPPPPPKVYGRGEPDPATTQTYEGGGRPELLPENRPKPNPRGDMWDRAVDFIDETVSGILGTGRHAGGAGLDEPMLPLSRLLPDPEKDENPLLSAVRGATQGVEGITSRGALMTIAGTGALGALGRVGKAIQTVATAGFGTAAGYGVAQNVTEGAQKYQAGDVNGAAESWGLGSADLLFAALMARAIARSLPGTAADVKTAWDAWRGPNDDGPGGGGPGGGDRSFNFRGPSSSTPVRGAVKQGAGGSFTATNMPPSKPPVFSTPAAGGTPAEAAPVGIPLTEDLARSLNGGQLPEWWDPSWTHAEGSADPTARAPESPRPGAPEKAAERQNHPTIDPRTGEVTIVQTEASGLPPETTSILDQIIDEHDGLLSQIVAEHGNAHQAGALGPDAAMPMDEATARAMNGGELPEWWRGAEPRETPQSSLIDRIAEEGRTGTPREAPAPEDSAIPQDVPPPPPGFELVEPTPGTPAPPLDQPVGEGEAHPEGSQPLPPPKRKEAAEQQPVQQATETESQQPPTPQAAHGHTVAQTETATTAGGTKAEYVWRVVDASELVRSHVNGNPNPDFPQNLQPRARDRAASEVQIQDLMAKLDPAKLGRDASADRGAPMAVKQGKKLVMISGNGRTDAIDRLYEAGHPNAEKYRQAKYAEAQAGEYPGVNADDFLNIKRPVLVRQLVNMPQGEAGGRWLERFAQESNEDDKAQMGASETAKADASRLTPLLMEAFHPTAEGEILHGGNMGFLRAFFDEVVPPSQRGPLMDRDGAISQAGVTRVRNAVFAYAYGADTAALEKLAESADSNIRNVTNGMVQAAPAFARMRDGINRGVLYPGVDLASDVADAAAQLSVLRESGQTIPDYLKQIGLFGEDLSQEAKALLAEFHRNRGSAKRIAALLQNYARVVEAAGNPNQGAIFGNAAPPTKQEMLAAAIHLTEAESESETKGTGASEPSLFDESEPAPGVAPGTGSTGGAKEGEPKAEPAARPGGGKKTGDAPGAAPGTHPSGPGGHAGGQPAARPQQPVEPEVKPPAAVDDRRPQAQKKAAEGYAELLSAFSGLSGSWDGGKVNAFATIWTPEKDGDSEEIAEVDVKGTEASPVITITLKPNFAGKPGLEEWIRWLVQRVLDHKPTSLRDARRIEANNRHDWHQARNRSNRANITREEQSQAASQAKEFEERTLRFEGIVAELEAGPPAAPAEGKPLWQIFAEEEQLTDKEIEFLEAAYQRLNGAGFKTNLELTALANLVFKGTRHSGAWDVKQVYDLLEGAVNKWIIENRKFRGFPELTFARELLAKLPRQADRSPGQEAFQQFSTPPTIAALAALAAGTTNADTVMEPSAGTGSLISWTNGKSLTNEIDPRRRAILRYLGFQPTEHDAEQLHNLSDAKPTVVIMNPPFTAAGNRGVTKDTDVWRRHVEQALLTLADGGRLVAILPGGLSNHPEQGASLDSPSTRKWWDAILAKYNVRANILLDGKEYGKYGTHYPTRLVVIDKTGATPGDTPVAQRASVVQTGSSTVEEALDAIRPIADDRADVPATPGDLLGGGPRPGGSPSPGSGQSPNPRSGGRSGSPGKSGPRGVRPSVPGSQPAPEPAPSGAHGPDAGIGGNPESPKPRAPVKHHAPPVELGANLEAQAQQDIAGGTYVRYTPAKLRGGVAHPAPIVQPGSLAAVDPPDITYLPKFDPSIVDEGKISNVQLEAVCYAGQRHERILANGERAGIFIGDGTGVGKGREIAAIIADNWAQGRRRAIWTSISSDLIEDAKRDLHDLGLDIPIRIVNDWKATEDIDLAEGIVFTTYASLIGESKETEDDDGKPTDNGAIAKRVDQLAKWAGAEGVIVFDEAHKAKNAWDSGQGEPTLTGKTVLELQEKLPTARVVYASATGATEVKNMAYMTRLGLWGQGTSFTEFGDFALEIENGGVGAMEMVARDLKARGAYMARTISYEGVDYRERVHDLSAEQRKMYDVASNAWLQVITRIEEAIAKTKAPGRARGRALSQFWAAHQRFFKQLITAIKVPTAIEEIEKALADNASVVISVATTGEAQQNRMLQKVKEGGGSLDDIDWTPREVLDRLIVQVFPIHAYEEVMKNGKKVVVPVLDADGKPVIDRQALAMREALRDSLSDMALPGNPIDLLIEHFEKKGIGVAELTGRKERIGIDPKTGKKALKKRKAEGVAAGKTNLAEVQAFQDGKKRIAIISDAASTGISLHASNRAQNKQRRVHIALELKWSADKQLQDFGRTHRSDQASAPEYVLLSVDIGGDKRFSATIARRLGSLGALTKGSREASGAGEIAKYNFESEYGRTAQTATLAELRRTDDGRETLADMGLLKRNPDTKRPTGEINDADLGNVPRFLNRVLSLPVDRQNELFNQFVQHFGAAIDAAKRNGTFDEGVSDLKGALAVRLTKSEEIPTNQGDGAKTFHYAFEVDEETHPADFKRALDWKRNRSELMTDKSGPAAGFYQQSKSGHVVMATHGGSTTDPKSGRAWRRVAVLRPSGNTEYLSEEEFQQKYAPVSDTLARAWWDEAYKRIPKMRTREMHLIGGAVLGVWRQIQASGAAGLEVVRVPLDNGGRLVGLEIPNAHVAEVLKALGVGRELIDPKAIFTGVVEQGEEIQLAGGIKLRRTMVHREPAFEIADAPSTVFGQIRAIAGVIEERIDGKLRFFIPTDPQLGQPVLDKLLEKFPVLRQTTGGGPAYALRQTPPDPNAPIAEVLDGADAEFRPTADYVAINWQARHVITACLQNLGFPARAWEGTTLGVRLGRRLLAHLEASPLADVQRIVPAVRAAVDAGLPVILVEEGPHIPGDEILAEERFHRAQYIAGGGNEMVELRANSARRLALHPAAVRVARLLRGEATYPFEELQYEVPAHVARGPAFWSRAGISPEQAASLLDLYYSLVERDHGRGTADALRKAAHDAKPTTGEANPLRREPAGAQEHRQSGEAHQDESAEEPGPGKGPAYALASHGIGASLQAVAETHDEFRKVFNPTARGDAGGRAAFSLREHAAVAAREYLQAEHALTKARVHFSKTPWQESLDFINRIEAGERQPSEQLQQWADTIRQHLDRQRDAVQGLGTGKLQTFYETYFPHIWQRPAQAADAFKRIFAKRPIEGPKSFLKQRKYQSFQEGVDAGLTPVSENAIDLVLLKLKEMDRYLLAHRFLQEMKQVGLVRYVPILKRRRAPKGWVELPDPIGTVWGPPHIQVKEAQDADMWNGLVRVAEHLGVDHRRVPTMRGGRWGFSVKDQDRVVTRYAGPESVLIHEIGHVLDQRYGLAKTLVNGTYKQELRDLADLRILPDDPESQQKYYRKGSEKIANMVAAYVHARGRFKKTAPQLFAWFDRFVKMHPELEELAGLEYGVGLQTRRQQYPVGGLILRGHYYMPEAAAHVVKNFLAPGLAGKAWYRGARGLSNSMLQFALGFSGYHAGFTTYEAMVSRLALGVEDALTGHPLKAAGQVARIPVTPFTNVLLGNRVLKEYFADAIGDPELSKYVDAIIQAGGRVKMDELYRTRFRQQFADAWRRAGAQGKLAQVAGPHHLPRNLAAVAEAAAWPVMEWLVPRQKVGAFCNIARHIVETHPDATPEELRVKFAAAWDSIDNRFGQMVYDNLFFDKLAKDILMISVQSLGWNLGTFREIGGGAVDWLKYGAKGAHYLGHRIGGGGGRGAGGGVPPGSGGSGPGDGMGEGAGSSGEPGRVVPPPEVTHRMAYVLALGILTATMGATINYLNTKGTRRPDGSEDDGLPQGYKDLYFPRTGNWDEQGHAERINMIGYVKDVFHWFHDPAQAARNKLNPLVRWFAETFVSNKDYWNVKIADFHDPWPKIVADEALHTAGFFVPYSIRNLIQERERGGGLGMQLAPQIGITAAPAYITRTPAQNRMGELARAGQDEGGMSHETFNRLAARRELVNAMKRRDGTAAAIAQRALTDGKLTPRDIGRVIGAAAKDRDVVAYKRLQVDGALDVYRLANPGERRQFAPILIQKLLHALQTLPAEEFRTLRERYQDVFDALLKKKAA